jgi:hypothetical protein
VVAWIQWQSQDPKPVMSSFKNVKFFFEKHLSRNIKKEHKDYTSLQRKNYIPHFSWQ